MARAQSAEPACTVGVNGFAQYGFGGGRVAYSAHCQGDTVEDRQAELAAVAKP
jgi:hypothetical protein